jgi:checkpoint serine/threonine-protein kinase
MVEPYKDLLDVYIRYVLYEVCEMLREMRELTCSYVAFSAEQQITSGSHIIPLLESTTRRFTDDGRYQQDNRYLGLWVMFARHIERREEIWSFLDSRNICTNHAAFYEEWAIALEGLGRSVQLVLALE